MQLKIQAADNDENGKFLIFLKKNFLLISSEIEDSPAGSKSQLKIRT